MSKFFHKLSCLFLIVALLLCECSTVATAIEPGSSTSIGTYETTILFTHDMHSHFLSAKDNDGSLYGGFARLATAINEQKELYPDALLLDAGDFSMGSIFQAVYTTDAPELRIMGMLGYDATTFGNHEYDFRESGFAQMLLSAAASGDTLPALLEANYLPPTSDSEEYDSDDSAVWSAFEAAGVQEYTIIERNGINYGIFGIMGVESDEDAPESGMILYDPAETAQRIVNEIKSTADSSKPLFIICLSHSGTSESGTSEDEDLAAAVDGIDVIVSGHSHTVLNEPIIVNNTYIVSSGCYTKYLGELVVSWDAEGNKTITDYNLIPIDSSISEDQQISEFIDQYKNTVTENYLSKFGYTDFDQVLCTNKISFDTEDDVYEYHRESGLGDLIADSYMYAINNTLETQEPTIALTATGVIRDSFEVGDITVQDVFNVSSLGIGADGLAGYPLVSAYLTGKEIKALCEVDASVSPIMSAAQLHISGLSFEWNSNRMIFNKVTDVKLMNDDGTLEELDNDELYRVVTGLYCAQMLSAVKTKSYGILSIVPKYADGTEVTDFDSIILHDENGNEIKEWNALAQYISSFENNTIPDSYANTQCTTRKIQKDSWNPINLISNPNKLTFAVLCLILALLISVCKLISFIHKKLKKARRLRRIPKGAVQYIQTDEETIKESFSIRSKRYGKGYNPELEKGGKRRVRRSFRSASGETLIEKIRRIEKMDNIDEVLGFVKGGPAQDPIDEDSSESEKE